MSASTRELILRHWELANARRWNEFAALLHPGLRYELPQTREYIESGDGYFEMFRTWPGNWQATVKDLVCEPDKAVCVIDFQVEDKTMTGISFLEVASDLIFRVTDYWPSPYDPPSRETPHMKRRGP